MIEKYLHVIPKVEYLPDYNPVACTGWQGVEALWYEGAEYKGKPTKVFAYIGYPEMKKGEKVPAVVLAHGGGGHAFAHWIKIWNARGYAAIAMNTEGFFPAEEWKGLTGTEGEPKDRYVRELYGELADDNYTIAPKNDGMVSADLPQDEQWIYQAVADVILAHNILKADECIDSDKIGICGVSWGSVITSLAIGYDTDYAFAIPIYGSAYLEYAATNVCRGFKEERIRQLWSAADRLSKVQSPVLWLCALYDSAFSSYSNSRSYLDTKNKGSFLSVQEELFHSHKAAWGREESYHFADSVLAGKQAFILPVEEPESFEECRFRVAIPEEFEDVAVRLVYFTEDFQFDENSQPLNKGYIAPASLHQDVVTAEIPKEAFCYYIEFRANVNGKNLISTTSWVCRNGGE